MDRAAAPPGDRPTRRPRPSPRARRLLALGALAAVALNAIAARHAWRMTHFVPAERGLARPTRPEELSAADKLGLLLLGLEIPRPENRADPGDAGLAFETERFAAEDGTALQAWFLPADDPRALVVCLHGYTGRAEHLLAEAAFFHARRFACLLVDFRGSGGSAGDATSLGWHEALDVAAAVEHGRGLVDAPVLVYAQSMGAVAAMRAIAGGRVEVDALIAESPYPALLATIEKRFHLMGLPAFPGAPLLAFWGGRQLDFDPFELRPLRDAESVTVPTLLLAGARDRRVLESESRAIFAALAGEKSLAVFGGAGHAPLRDDAPEAWEAAVGAFCERF